MIFIVCSNKISNRVTLRGEGNENGEKTTAGLISKKETLHVQHTFCTFLCRCFARPQRENSRNFLVTRFMEEMSYVFLFTIFSLPLIFTLMSASISHFLTAATKFSCCSSNRKSLLCYLSLALAPCRSFPRWALLPAAYFLFSLSFSFFTDVTKR